MEIIQYKKNGNYTTQFFFKNIYRTKFVLQIKNNLIQMQSN